MQALQGQRLRTELQQRQRAVDLRRSQRPGRERQRPAAPAHLSEFWTRSRPVKRGKIRPTASFKGDGWRRARHDQPGAGPVQASGVPRGSRNRFNEEPLSLLGQKPDQV